MDAWAFAGTALPSAEDVFGHARSQYVHFLYPDTFTRDDIIPSRFTFHTAGSTNNRQIFLAITPERRAVQRSGLVLTLGGGYISCFSRTPQHRWGAYLGGASWGLAHVPGDSVFPQLRHRTISRGII